MIVNMPREYKLYFEVNDDKSLFLWINDHVILPFRNETEWKDFANQMLGMIDGEEMKAEMNE